MLSKKIILGLGSNLGDKNLFLDKAVEALKNELFLTDIKRSKILKNPAMVLPNSPDEWNQEFFNIAVSGNVDLQKFSPEKILEIIKKIERDLGRKESDRWAPREIDIDILTIEDLVVKIEGKLIIPHYDLMNREFFLKTIKDIEPEWVYPV